MSRRFSLVALATLSQALAIAGTANAADVTFEEAPLLPVYPFIEGELIWEIQKDNTYKSDDPAAELYDAYGYLELATTIGLAPFMHLNSVLVIEPVRDPVGDRIFEDHGGYAEELNLEFIFSEDTSLVLGKFGPGFGTAWDVTPGIYGTDFAEDYQLAEYIGLGFSHAFDAGGFGAVTFGANAFYQDTTTLSESVFVHRGRTTLAAGGAGNTERLDNFSVTLDGSEVPALPGFAWHLGYRHLSAGQGDVADEHGYVAGFVQEAELSNDWGIAFNGEYALLKNTGGTANNTSYATGGLTVTHGSWHLDLAATLRDVDVSGGPDNDDVLWQASLGFADQNDIDWNLGYRFTEVANVESHTFGLFVTQAIGFSTR